MTTNDKEYGQYWGDAGRYKAAADELSKRIPMSGSVAEPRRNRMLERYRKAVNCYYDLYNNGLCNRSAEFRQVFGKFGISASQYRCHYRHRGRRINCIDFKAIAPPVEAAMDSIIRDAALEQGLWQLILDVDHNYATAAK